MGTHDTARHLSVGRGWAPNVVLPLAVLLLTPSAWPRWALMWLLGAAVFGGAKWLTWRRTPVPGTSIGRHLGYLLAWPGLDARAFLSSEPLPATQRPRVSEWIEAAMKILAGIFLVWGVASVVPEPFELVRGWVGMIGFVLVLHFGAFHLQSCAWRASGVDARRLMNAPLLATSVSDFWGRRWNTAFRDLTHRFLFRPLTARIGPRGALVVGFVFSGLVHELVISVPAHGGFGGPTLFFCVQIPAMLLERSKAGKALGLGRGWHGWLFTALVLIAPAGLLFHPPFVRGVVLPFMQAIGAG
jgi:hypothetical protein